jgi:hypothetical protein
MTTLTNSYIRKFDEKLKIYDSIFFKTIDAHGGLLTEASKIMDPNGLNIPTDVSATSYSTSQFSNFIRNIINFNIKNFDSLDNRDNNMGFVNRTFGRDGQPVYSFNQNVKNNIIETLKVVNVFVDILEAYKYCIDKGEDTNFKSGFDNTIAIDRIELVSDRTRFYSGASNGTMTPEETIRNVGYIRSVLQYSGAETSKKVLYLSIQSFDTRMFTSALNYDKLFTLKAGATTVVDKGTNILNTNAREDISEAYPLNSSGGAPNYKRQEYKGRVDDPSSINNLTLENRNKALITLLLKTLFNLDTDFRKQSVYALYYYYKFVQLYSTFIINLSNVMYADVKATTLYRIETRNMSTKSTELEVSAIEIIESSNSINISGVANTVSYGFSGGAPATPTTVAAITGSGNALNIVRGKGYTIAPTLTLTGTGSSGKTASVSIAPMVTDESASNTDNIEKLRKVISEVSDSLTVLLDNISSYSANNNDVAHIITTSTSEASGTKTKVSLSSRNNINIIVYKSTIYDKLNNLTVDKDLVSDYVIYDKINKRYYNIININNEEQTNFQIELAAVFSHTDIVEGDVDTKLFINSTRTTIGRPAVGTEVEIASDTDFLEIRQKDTNAYKSEYIYNRNDLSKLDENIGYNTSKVTHQKNLYDAQYSKNVFLERQVLAYNIILAVIVVILVVINVMNLDKPIVQTISLACMGSILLLFVIYFISNITYIETFALDQSDVFNELTLAHYNTKKLFLTPPIYTRNKIEILKSEIEKLNSKFISYFEKVIITLPSADNLDFYREIKDVITNDRDNKQFINKRLEYNKSQNSNDLNSLKYELENNKLYINTLLISAIIFVGIYNLYINYASSDKYLTLMIFISIIIFIIIFSYYIITSNRRVKTVFNNVYWGPEFSKNF